MSSEVAVAVAAMIAERQQAREAAFEQRRATLDEFVTEKAKRRDWGLRQRHARKLARIKRQPSIT